MSRYKTAVWLVYESSLGSGSPLMCFLKNPSLWMAPLLLPFFLLCCLHAPPSSAVIVLKSVIKEKKHNQRRFQLEQSQRIPAPFRMTPVCSGYTHTFSSYFLCVMLTYFPGVSVEEIFSVPMAIGRGDRGPSCGSPG